MRCEVCEGIEGQGECAECQALADDLRANAEALSALHDEELSPLVIRISRRRPVYPWLAAAAAVLLAMILPYLHQNAQSTTPAKRGTKSEAMTIKMLTPDPDVVIYWLIDSKEGELR